MEKLLVLQHVSNESPGLFTRFAQGQNVKLDVVELHRPYQIPDVEGYAGLIIMGGPMGVYEDYPSKEDEIATIHRALGKIPVLGVCLGSQLLAHALGAEVYPNKIDGRRVREIGYYDVDITAEGSIDPIFRGLTSSLNVLEWHGDAFDLPETARLLATSPNCKNQAFVHISNGIPAYGMLFHLEATPEMIEGWIASDNGWRHEGFDFNDQQVIEQARAKADLMEKQCERLFGNFLSMVKATR